ncbi:MAG: oxaloacetate decarboxylase subunit gamma [Gammaproteobacteria bacterium]|nr:oxaloacetate decarboxylase subunit gamma [Gammaproteobacteria bacterium]
MNIEQLLLQSLQLLGLGMGSVFIILSLLIVIIQLVSRLVPEQQIAQLVTPAPATSTEHIAAMQAAIHQYRRDHQA